MQSPSATSAISGRTLTELYAGKRVLVVGGTGFLGSATLSLLMLRLPELERLYVLVRKSPGLEARRRFMERVLPGAAFEPVRERLGDDFARLVEQKLEILQGDLAQPDAGLDAQSLQLDLILNASGLVDFHAPLDLAHRTNVGGTRHLVGLARATGAALVHTSTCYVAGSRTGHVAEDVVVGRFPRRDDAAYLDFDAAQEDEDIAAEIQLVKAQLDTRPARARLAEQAVARHRAANGCDPTPSQLANAVKRAQRDQLTADLVEAGRRRAAAWGWPNVYTYTKAVAEQLLATSGVRHALVRPAIIESALAYPTPGWNQNATTSAPLVMLALAGFDQVPARAGHVLDIVPVDMVAWTLLAAGAAVMADAHRPVYQVGTGDSNPVTMGRVTDLLGLYLHERELGEGREGVKRLWKANREPRLVAAERFKLRASLVTRSAVWLAERARAGGDRLVDPRARSVLAKLAGRAEATSADIEKARGLWDVFMPFSHDHEYRFATGHTRELAAAIAPEPGTPTFAPESLDWRHYWLDVHVPGLEKWVLSDTAAGGAIKALPATAGLVERIEGVAMRDPHRQAIALLAGPYPAALTYAQVWNAAGGLAAALATCPEGPVRVTTEALSFWPVAVLAAWRAGRAVELVRPRQRGAEGLAPAPAAPEANVDAPAAKPGTPAELALAVPTAQAARLATPGEPARELPLDTRPDTPPAGLSTATPSARLTFPGGPSLEARALAERLSALGGEVGLANTDGLLLALPPHDGREADAHALLLLAALYQQASVDLVAADGWADALAYTASSVVALGDAGWQAAPDGHAAGALARVARVVDFAPASARADRRPFFRQGARVLQPLFDAPGAALVAMRSLEGDQDEAAAFLAVPPWKLRVQQGQLEATQGTSDDWQPTGWAATALDEGGFRLEGAGREGPGARLEADLLRPGKLTVAAIQPPVPGEHGLRAIVVPDLDAIESIQALRRHVLDEAWRYNQKATFSERIRAVGLALDAADAPTVWLDTRHKPRHDDTPDLETLRDDTLAIVAPRFTPTALAFYRERLDAATLTYERLASWERVLVRALEAGDLTTQAFLQAFEHELSRTRTPGYRAARTVGRLLARVSTWAADEQPEAPLLPEPVSEVLRKGVGLAAMAFYRHGLEVTVRGAAYIPAGENFLVVGNHSSHLDGGLVKYALGAWGDRLHTLAAKDYFFGTPARRFVAHHFTRLVPTERKAASTEWLRRAREILLNGDCVLIFPEGTRTAGPTVGAFKASLGTLVRQAEVSILPVRIVGTDAILPKGAALPKGRKATIHIGPPIPWRVLAERTAELGALAQDRAIAALVQEAVDGLPDGRFWWLDGWQERRVAESPASEAEALP